MCVVRLLYLLLCYFAWPYITTQPNLNISTFKCASAAIGDIRRASDVKFPIYLAHAHHHTGLSNFQVATRNSRKTGQYFTKHRVLCVAIFAWHIYLFRTLLYNTLTPRVFFRIFTHFTPKRPKSKQFLSLQTKRALFHPIST